MAVFGIASENANDEISNFQMGRYVSTNEALWRLLSFQIHERYPTVVHLAVHLENGQRVYFTEANAAQRAERPPSTTLTSFFAMCEADPFAATLMYVEMPHIWNQSTKKFQRRKQGTPVPDWPQCNGKIVDAMQAQLQWHKKSLEALNFTLKDLRRNNNIFGGLMILLAGDFRQTLPVVPVERLQMN
ncbi:hypothetical protein EVAR_57564_1 [Eumeta japonica]|uniref:ATP-dependent DNA helicase n=1 Tax=Eumeta variegata TaxID=151549 RepID=A0A4C2A4M4_EUMVA|nr:hypothetical protein EVAR_57564_1 [Eumeta japonica]